MQPNLFPITLERSYMVSPSVKHFVFRSALDPKFTYLPGQFITIHFEFEDKVLRRSYSIANVPANDNRIEFAAGYIAGGPGTDLLFNLNPGDTININGPFGRLTLKDEIPGRYILVATSTGVTPYRAMFDELYERLKKHPSLQVVVLLGVSTRQDAIYHEEFLTFMQKSSRISFRLYFSREPSSNLQAHEYRGYVQHAFPDLALNAEQDVIYLCGNPAMIDDAFLDLKNINFPSNQVIREKYISAK